MPTDPFRQYTDESMQLFNIDYVEAMNKLLEETGIFGTSYMNIFDGSWQGRDQLEKETVEETLP